MPKKNWKHLWFKEKMSQGKNIREIQRFNKNRKIFSKICRAFGQENFFRQRWIKQNYIRMKSKFLYKKYFSDKSFNKIIQKKQEKNFRFRISRFLEA